jgi:hypothetical protein
MCFGHYFGLTDHATPLYPQKLAHTSPTSGGRSVGIIHSRTKATELFSLVVAETWCRNCVVAIDLYCEIGTVHNRKLQYNITEDTEGIPLFKSKKAIPVTGRGGL